VIPEIVAALHRLVEAEDVDVEGCDEVDEPVKVSLNAADVDVRDTNRLLASVLPVGRRAREASDGVISGVGSKVEARTKGGGRRRSGAVRGEWRYALRSRQMTSYIRKCGASGDGA
jgi:hypothetical protein